MLVINYADYIIQALTLRKLVGEERWASFQNLL